MYISSRHRKGAYKKPKAVQYFKREKNLEPDDYT